MMREEKRLLPYAPPEITPLGKVEELTADLKGTGPPDILARHRLIG